MDPKQPNTPQDPPGKRRPPMPMRALLAWFLLMALLITIFQLATQHGAKQASLPYNPDFLTLLQDGRINKCEVVMEISGQHYIRGELKDLDPATSKPVTFRVEAPVTENLVEKLTAAKVPFEFKSQNPLLWQILSSTLPFLLVFAVIYFFFYRNMASGSRGAFSFGKSRARLMTRDTNKITFKDVAGADEAREEVQEIIEFLRDPKKFQRLGGRIPKGVLLVGPPGTGKTLIARAIAGEAQVPFFNISGSDFVEMFVGVGASRVRDMFEQGRKSAPCIIFIDEIDAVGRSRFSGIGGGHDEREQTLNALLVEMDGFDTQEGVIIIAATNRPDVLDPALLRPGRFDRQIVVDLPNLEGREAILKIHARKVKLDAAVQLRNIARGTPGFSGADLANLMNEAALLAARRGADAINEKDLEEARDKVRWGRERRSRVLDDKEKRMTACHEAGHALVAWLLPGADPVHKVTIIPRGRALGLTMQLPEEERSAHDRTWLTNTLCTLLGGRVAEEIVFQQMTTGAGNDIERVSDIARRMVCEWGMSEVIGPLTFRAPQPLGGQPGQILSEATATVIDAEVKKLVQSAADTARQLLSDNRPALEALTSALLERETLNRDDIRQIVDRARPQTTAA